MASHLGSIVAHASLTWGFFGVVEWLGAVRVGVWLAVVPWCRHGGAMAPRWWCQMGRTWCPSRSALLRERGDGGGFPAAARLRRRRCPRRAHPECPHTPRARPPRPRARPTWRRPAPGAPDRPAGPPTSPPTRSGTFRGRRARRTAPASRRGTADEPRTPWRAWPRPSRTAVRWPGGTRGPPVVRARPRRPVPPRRPGRRAGSRSRSTGGPRCPRTTGGAPAEAVGPAPPSCRGTGGLGPGTAELGTHVLDQLARGPGRVRVVDGDPVRVGARSVRT